MPRNQMTIEEMTENLNLAAEEVILQCMILNHRGIVQAHFSANPHVHTIDVRVMPANTKWKTGLDLPDKLGYLNVYTGFSEEDFDDRFSRTRYLESMAKIQDFIQYLDDLIEAEKPIITDVQGDAA